MSDMKDFVKQCLYAYGQAMHNDWDSINGRTARGDLETIACMLDWDGEEPNLDEFIEFNLGVKKDEYGDYHWG